VHLRPVPHQRWRAVTGNRPWAPPGSRGSPRARRRRDRPQRAREGQRVRAGPAAARSAGSARRAGRPDGSGSGGSDDDGDGRPRECQAMSTMSLPSAARRTAGLARRHKVITGVVALFVAAVIAVSLATRSTQAPPPGDPAAAGFTLLALGQ